MKKKAKDDWLADRNENPGEDLRAAACAGVVMDSRNSSSFLFSCRKPRITRQPLPSP
jgi:hypothetical protein